MRTQLEVSEVGVGGSGKPTAGEASGAAAAPHGFGTGGTATAVGRFSTTRRFCTATAAPGAGQYGGMPNGGTPGDGGTTSAGFGGYARPVAATAPRTQSTRDPTGG